MILAIDTATKSLGIALQDGHQVLAETVWNGKGYHTVELAPEVGLILQRVGASLVDIDTVAVAIGPGSYTGLRIGLAFAKGLSLARGIIIRPISTFDILAQIQPKQNKPMFTAIVAGRGRIAGCWYRWERNAWKPEGTPINTTWEAFKDTVDEKVLVVGEIEEDGFQRLSTNNLIEIAPPALCVRRPSVLAGLAMKAKKSRKKVDPGTLIPVYLEPQDG